MGAPPARDWLMSLPDHRSYVVDAGGDRRLVDARLSRRLTQADSCSICSRQRLISEARNRR